MKFRHIVFAIVAIAIFQACNSPDSFDCIKQRGDLSTITIQEYSPFNELIIYDNIELEIVESEQEYFELTYGENLISKIVIEEENDSLSFYNQNFCDWTRGFEKPKLKWFTSRATIIIKSLSNGKIISNDTIKSDLNLRMQDATNDIELLVNNSTTTLSSNTASNFVVAGQCNRLRVYAYFNDGKFDCRNLNTNRADVLHRGYNDILVNVRDSLVGSIENAGRILYTGNPGVKVEVSNGGELIHLDQE